MEPRGDDMKIKGFLLAGAAVAPVAAPAMAADMGMPLKAAPAPVAAPSWAGWYIGATLGGVAQQGSFFTDGNGTTNHNIGVIGGGEIGYNWQHGSFVFGLEADGSGLSGGTTQTGPASSTYSEKISWLSTVRGRFGLAFGDTMAYATAGVAIGGMRNDAQTNDFGGAYSDHKARAGLAVGAGVAHMLDAHWSVKLEGLWVDFSDRSVSCPGCGQSPTELTRFSNSAIIARMGVDYKF